MLVNLSNHPSDKWGEDQKEAAKKFGKIVDLPDGTKQSRFEFVRFRRY